MVIRDAPAVNEFAVKQSTPENESRQRPVLMGCAQGDYREHIEYDKYHRPDLSHEHGPKEHMVQGGDYREHANFGDHSRAPGGYQGE